MAGRTDLAPTGNWCYQLDASHPAVLATRGGAGVDELADPLLRQPLVERALLHQPHVPRRALIEADARYARVVRRLQALAVEKPVVAAINGACAGIGLVTALMADVR